MNGLNGMDAKLARLEERAPKPPETHAIELNLDLFTDEEQSHIETLLQLIDYNDNHLYKLSNNQLEYLDAVVHLNDLGTQSGERASKYRRHMAELSATPHFTLSLVRLVALFLSLDEQRMPDYAESKEWYKQPHPEDYQMRRAYYRQRKAWIEEVRDKSRSWRDDGLWGIGMYEDEMLRWVEAYAGEQL